MAICHKSLEPSFKEVMDFFVLLAYARLAASRTLLQWLLTCLSFILHSGDLSFWCKWKKWFLWTMAAAQAAENHGDEWWDLTWYFWQGNSNQNPLTKFSSSSSRSTEFKDILPWNISQIITKTIPISMRIVISYEMQLGIPLWIFGKSMETETTTWSEFSSGGKACRTKLASEELNKSNCENHSLDLFRNVGILQSHVGMLTIWVRFFDYNTVHQVCQFYEYKLASSYDGH